MTDYTYAEYVDGSNVSVCLTLADTFWSKSFFLGGTVIFFVIPLAILVILYSVIAVNLMTHPGIVPVTRQVINLYHYVFRNDQTLLSSQNSDMKSKTYSFTLKIKKPKGFPLPTLFCEFLQDSSSSAHKYRKQVIMMLGTVVVFFFICLLPFRALIVWIVVAPHEDVMELGNEGYYNLLYFCRIMFYLNSAINPILYNLMSSKFRNGFLKLCGLKKNCFRKHTRALLRNSTFNTSSLTHTSAITTSSIHRTSINESERKKSSLNNRPSKKEQNRRNSCSKSLIFKSSTNNLTSSLKNYLTKGNCDNNQKGSDRDKCHFKFIQINRKKIRRRKSFSDFLYETAEDSVSIINHSHSLDSIFKTKQCRTVPRLSRNQKINNNNVKGSVRFVSRSEDAISLNKKIITKHISDAEGLNISEDVNCNQNGCDSITTVQYSKSNKKNDKVPGFLNKQVDVDQVFNYRIIPASAFKRNKTELKESFV